MPLRRIVHVQSLLIRRERQPVRTLEVVSQKADLAVGIVLTGINPVEITEYSVVFAVVALPMTYLPILMIAGDRSFMGERANGRISSTLGWLYFAVIVVLAVVAIPLLLMTNGGGG